MEAKRLVMLQEVPELENPEEETPIQLQVLTPTQKNANSDNDNQEIPKEGLK